MKFFKIAIVLGVRIENSLSVGMFGANSCCKSVYDETILLSSTNNPDLLKVSIVIYSGCFYPELSITETSHIQA